MLCLIKKIDNDILVVGNTGSDKPKFHCLYNLILMNIVNIDKILISIKVSFGKKCYKYFIHYKYEDYKINLLCITLLKMKLDI